MNLKEFGYPQEGIVYVDIGGGNDFEAPQEMWSAHTCGSCGLFNGTYCTKEWNNAEEDYCIPWRDEKDPDTDSCNDIDYIEEELEELRDPVRCEYSTDKAYEQACKAVVRIRKHIQEREEGGY